MTGAAPPPDDGHGRVAGPFPERVDAGAVACRRVRPDDAGPLLEAVTASLDHLRPWMPWVADGYSAGMADAFVAAASDRPDPDLAYAVLAGSDRLVGVCGLHDRLGPGRLEIGYWVDVAHTGRGIATLAAALLSEVALGPAGAEAVEIHHDRANRRSARIPARLGYERVGAATVAVTAPGEVGVEWRWRMTAEAWERSPGARILADARTAARPG